ncbi:MAG: HD-GYP domain-containing protein [Patulibacter minatonensis]
MDPLAEQHHQERKERLAMAAKTRQFTVAAVATGCFLAAAAAFAVLGGPIQANVPMLICAVLAYVGLAQVEFEIGPVSTSPIQAPFVILWFAIDPHALPLVAGGAELLGYLVKALRSKSALTRIARGSVFNIADAGYSFGPAIVLFALAPATASLDHWWVYALALGAQFGVDWLSTGIRILLSRASAVPASQFLWTWSIDAGLAPLGLTAALASADHPWVALTLLPLAAILAQFAKERDERILHAVELSSAYRGTAQLMGDVLEADDAYTGGEHTQGVVGLALDLGRAIELDAREMRNLEFGALLHDIGKLRVPNEIINKPGKLTDEEWAIIKLHPAWGQEMLDRVGGQLTHAGVIVRAHHERWDGGGYPDGLAGEDIPVAARIITICDSYSAMTTDRSYRKGMSVADALAELERCAGSQFDPTLVAHARELLAGAEAAKPVAPAPLRVVPAAGIDDADAQAA